MAASVHYSDDWLTVWAGDCRSAMDQMPEQSVHAVVTSPPYFGLRDYGLPPSVWGGDPDHSHEWGAPRGQYCECGAWLGCLGLEPTPEAYVDHLVDVFRSVRRVLRDDGVAWLNLGDSYATQPGKGDNVPQTKWKSNAYPSSAAHRSRAFEGIKPKDLIGVPWLAAFALRADGWYLRQEIVWSKPNAMPESVEDRPSRSHEFIFMLTKRPTYFYDHEAVKEPASEATLRALAARLDRPIEDREYQHDSETRMGKRSPNRVWSDPDAMRRLMAGRNLRDVWSIPTTSYPGAHFATFPPKLVEPMVKASTSEGGVCYVCGTPYEREMRNVAVETAKGGKPHTAEYGQRMHGMTDLDGEGETGSGFGIVVKEMLFWRPVCMCVCPGNHACRIGEPHEVHDAPPVPATVLDPFGGSGTVAKVAQSLSRRAILIDLNPDYIEQQMERNAQVSLGL